MLAKTFIKITTLISIVLTRDSIYAIARICYRPSVRLSVFSVCHTGGSYKNGRS